MYLQSVTTSEYTCFILRQEINKTPDTDGKKQHMQQGAISVVCNTETLLLLPGVAK